MTIQQRKNHFIQLGKFLGQFNKEGFERNLELAGQNDLPDRFEEQINMAIHYNGWFIRENVIFALHEWNKALTKENLDRWLEDYDLENINPKRVGIIMAGNIPLVGFHDFISVLISGHRVLVKQSANDQRLLPIIAEYLIMTEPSYSEFIEFTSGKMDNFDAVIATGSNNTSRYFEYYFANKPSIIRKNRNSVAVLSGNESPGELKELGNDIFRYFGLGCRNVSKLYLPVDYDFHDFYTAIEPWNELLNHAKYANNYDYNKAVYLMSEFKFLDNGFLMLKEAGDFSSPIGTVFYENYTDEASLKTKLEENKENLQCIVAHNFSPEEVSFGNSQHPRLWDFADNVDTLAFLQNL